MSFFDSIPQPPPPEPVRHRRPAWMRSDAVIPGLVPWEAMLARTGQVAVAVGGLHAYPNGFEFTVHARLRREHERRELQLYASVEPDSGKHDHTTGKSGTGTNFAKAAKFEPAPALRFLPITGGI